MENPFGDQYFAGKAVILGRDPDGGVNEELTLMVDCRGKVKVLKSEDAPSICYVYLIIGGDGEDRIMEIKFEAMEE